MVFFYCVNFRQFFNKHPFKPHEIWVDSFAISLKYAPFHLKGYYAIAEELLVGLCLRVYTLRSSRIYAQGFTYIRSRLHVYSLTTSRIYLLEFGALSFRCERTFGVMVDD